MLNIIVDSVRFPEALEAGRTITKTYSTYPYRVYQAATALQGIDYGFSDSEGPFFRSTIQTKAEILSAYQVRVTIVFGFRAQEFNKRVDATVNYALFVQVT